MRNRYLKTALAAAFISATLLLPACSPKSNSADMPENVAKDVSFSITASVPSKFENVEGTALFSASSDLKEQLVLLQEKAPMGVNAFYILLNSRKPTEGILVKAQEDISSELINSQTSKKIKISGPVKELPACDLDKYCMDKYSITLAKNSAGNIIWVESTEPLDITVEKPESETPAAQPQGNSDAQPEGSSEAAAPADQAPQENSAAEENAQLLEDIPAPEGSFPAEIDALNATEPSDVTSAEAAGEEAAKAETAAEQ